jgi:hypothetical protein
MSIRRNMVVAESIFLPSAIFNPERLLLILKRVLLLITSNEFAVYIIL